MNRSIAGAGKIALSFLIWSTWALFFRKLGMPALTLTFYLAATTIGVSYVCARATKTPVGKPTLPLLWMGIGMVLTNVTFFYAIEKTTVANALFTHHFTPVFVALMAPWLIREKPLATLPFSVGLSLFGLYLILPGDPFTNGATVIGSASGLLSAVFYAILIIMMRKWAGGIDRLRIIFWQNLVAASVLLPFAAFTAAPTRDGLLLVLLLSSVHSVLVPFTYLSGIRTTSAQAASVMGYVEPLSATLLASLFLGEKMHPAGWLGGALIILGGVLLIYEEAKRGGKPA